jgi:tetratricopeptide (TPR) repeat protein
MAAHIREETLELECDLQDATVPRAGAPWPCYPYLPLVPSGRRGLVASRTVTMENAHLCAKVALDLGGRLIELTDRRSGTAILPEVRALRPEAAGPRGAWLREGVQIMADGPMRANGIGPVESLILGGGDGEPAELLLHELTAERVQPDEARGGGLSWHATWRLPATDPWLELDVRTLNRGFGQAAYCGGLSVHFGGGQALLGPHGVAVYDTDRDAGVFLIAGDGDWEAVDWDGGTLWLYRRAERGEGRLWPRQCDSWTVRLFPLAGLGGLTAFWACGALHLDGRKLRVWSAAALQGATVVAQVGDGRAFVATVSAGPGDVAALDLAGLPGEPAGLALLSANRDELVRWVAGEPQPDLAAAYDAVPRLPPAESARWAHYVEALRMEAAGDDPARYLHAAAHDPALRPAALVRLAMRATARQDWEEADRLLEEALLVGAEDHLAWWLKAVVGRMAHGPGAERPELANAHYLAPLEPALRAEGFLSIPEPAGPEPSPLLRALAERPESVTEVACLLLEAGLRDQAARLMDEALRHREHPGLRYLLAWALLTGSRMDVEAAAHVRRAASAPVEPPFPWRPLERRAVAELSARFPDDARLRALARLLGV